MGDDTRRVDARHLNTLIETARLRLEPLAARHAALLFEGMRDPAHYAWLALTPPDDAGRLARRWARVAARALVADDVFSLGWAVQRTEDGAWIGKLDAEVLPQGVATNVGYLFFAPFWRRGYASEAVAALGAHLARHGVVEQRATVAVGNDASQRVLERAGFVRTRTLPGNDVLRGVAHDDVEFVRRD